MAPGDTLFLYTDGLVENCGPNEEIFSTKDLKDALETAPLHPEGLRDVVLEKAGRVWREVPPADDVTMLVVQWNAAPGA